MQLYKYQLVLACSVIMTTPARAYEPDPFDPSRTAIVLDNGFLSTSDCEDIGAKVSANVLASFRIATTFECARLSDQSQALVLRKVGTSVGKNLLLGRSVPYEVTEIPGFSVFEGWGVRRSGVIDGRAQSVNATDVIRNESEFTSLDACQRFFSASSSQDYVNCPRGNVVANYCTMDGEKVRGVRLLATTLGAFCEPYHVYDEHIVSDGPARPDDPSDDPFDPTQAVLIPLHQFASTAACEDVGVQASAGILAHFGIATTASCVTRDDNKIALIIRERGTSGEQHLRISSSFPYDVHEWQVPFEFKNWGVRTSGVVEPHPIVIDGKTVQATLHEFTSSDECEQYFASLPTQDYAFCPGNKVVANYCTTNESSDVVGVRVIATTRGYCMAYPPLRHFVLPDNP